MNTDSHAVLFTLALRALLGSHRTPDDVVDAYETAGQSMPLIVDDPVCSAAEDLPCGLVEFATAARRTGIDGARTVLLHPSLVQHVPPVAPADRAVLARAAAVTVLEAGGVSRALVVLIGDVARVLPTPAVPYSPLMTITPGEAVRALRECVMEGLALVESLGDALPEHLRQAPWRDWQDDLARGGLSSGAAALVESPRWAASLVVAWEIHALLRPVLAPHTLEPQAFGALLARLHTAAAEVVTAITRAPAQALA